MFRRQNPKPSPQRYTQDELHRMGILEVNELWEAAREADERKRQIRAEFVKIGLIVSAVILAYVSVYVLIESFYG